MKKRIPSLLLYLALIVLAVSLALTVYAHPGRTDSAGGHTNRSTGEYHYHHGYGEHNHEDLDGDGDLDCPYDFKDMTDHSYKGGGSITNPTREPEKVEKVTPAPTSKPVNQNDEKRSKSISFGDVLYALCLAFPFALACGTVIYHLITFILSAISSIFGTSDWVDNAGCAIYVIALLASYVLLIYLILRFLL